MKEILDKWAAWSIQNGAYEEAEKIYVERGNWVEAANMYRRIHQWQDALRVTKSFGGIDAFERISFEYTIYLRGECKNIDSNIVNDALSYCLKNNDFENAIALAKQTKSSQFTRKLLLKHAGVLERDGMFSEAEARYIEANAWDDAKRIGKLYESHNVEKHKIPVGDDTLHEKSHEYTTSRFEPKDSLIEDTNYDKDVRNILYIRPPHIQDVSNFESDHKIEEDTVGINLPDASNTFRALQATLDLNVNEGNWGNVWDILINKLPNSTNKNKFSHYTTMRLEQLLNKDGEVHRNFAEVIGLLRSGVPIPGFQSNMQLYFRIVRNLLSFTDNSERSVDYMEMLDALIIIIRNASRQDISVATDRVLDSTLDHFVKALHYTKILSFCTKFQLHNLACKCAISLLRLSVITFENGEESSALIPPDKAFFNAGMCSKDAGFSKLAFVFFNSYIDRVEVRILQKCTIFQILKFMRTPKSNCYLLICDIRQ